jgi:hypothetical protein
MQGTQYHNGIPFQASTPKKVWRKIRKTIVIDSRDRQFTPQSSPGEYTVTLPAVYQNVYSAALKSIEIPFSFYTFSADAENTSISVTTGGTTAIITIQDGNYTASGLAAELETQLNDPAAGLTGTFDCTYSTVTSKLTITNDSSAFTLNISDTDPANVNCGKATNFTYNTWQNLAYYLGFNQQSVTSTSIGGVQTVVGDFAMNPSPCTYFLMDVGILNKIDETALDNKKSGRVNGAFAKIPVNVNTGDYIFVLDTGTSPLNYRVYNPPISKLSQLQIKFRHHDGRILDFNGVEHSFTLEFELLDNNFDEYSGAEFSQF